MKLYLYDQEVEAEIDSNRDGSRFILKGYFVDNGDDLSDAQLDDLQTEYDESEVLKGNWRGE
jgi:c-di-AMP phosphodiesterase-like protein